MDVKIKTTKTSGTHCKMIITDTNDNILWESDEFLWYHITGQLQTAESINNLMEQQKFFNSDWNFIETINEFE